MVSDLRDAFRSICRWPFASATVVLSIAAAVGINTVVFSWLQARFLEPVPGVSAGSQLRLIEPRSARGLYVGSSWTEFLGLRERLRTFESVFAARTAPFYVGEPGTVERVFGVLVSDNYFSVLGLQPALGRLVSADDLRADAPAEVAVISDRIWRSRFHASPDAPGRTLRINGREFVVIGVTPPRFQGTTPGLQYDVWVPAAAAPVVGGSPRELRDPGIRGYSVMGRLARGRSTAAAQAEVSAAMAQLAARYPETNSGVGAEVLPLHQAPRGPQRMINAALVVLQAVMFLLLLGVCGNLATLALARGSGRRHEMGIRLALGAPRWRIASLVLFEHVLLAAAGSAVGILVAVWGTQALLILPSLGMPLRFQTDIDATALGFAMTLGVLSGVVFGAAPAAHLARTGLPAAARSESLRAARPRLRNTLIATQVALALVVLTIAALFFRAVLESRTADTGFDRANLLLAAYDLSGRPSDARVRADLARRILERVRALPFVESAAIAASVPLDIHGMPVRTVTIAGRDAADGRDPEALVNTVTAGYFDAMRIPIVRGHDFSERPDAEPPLEAVVNEAFVREYVGAAEPVGRPIGVRGSEFRIVGVVRDSLYNAFGEPATPIVHTPFLGAPPGRGEIHARLRPGAPANAPAELARAVRAVDADLPVFNFRTMDEHVETNLVFRRIPARMFAVLAPMLLALSAVGLYAVVAHAVALRRREIGIRQAIGATEGRVLRGILREHLAIAAAGAAIGWCLAAAGAALAPQQRLDPIVFAAVPLVLLAVSAAACWIPARRGIRVDLSRVLSEG